MDEKKQMKILGKFMKILYVIMMLATGGFVVINIFVNWGSKYLGIYMMGSLLIFFIILTLPMESLWTWDSRDEYYYQKDKELE